MSIYKVGVKIPETARVGVYEPCSCSVCEDPKARWFQCPTVTERWIAEYACSPVIEAIDDGEVYTLDHAPAAEVLADIRAKHPGKTLVY